MKTTNHLEEDISNELVLMPVVDPLFDGRLEMLVDGQKLLDVRKDLSDLCL